MMSVMAWLYAPLMLREHDNLLTHVIQMNNGGTTRSLVAVGNLQLRAKKKLSSSTSQLDEQIVKLAIESQM